MGRAILAAIATAAAVTGLGACGVGGASGGLPGSLRAAYFAPTRAPSARALANAALTALKSARSVRIAGGVIEEGKRLHVDVGFIKPESLSGTLSGSFEGTQAALRVIVAGGKAYVLLDKAFFSALAKAHGVPASACSRLCGKYISAPAPDFGHFGLKDLTNSMFRERYKIRPGVTVTSVNGQPAYRVSYGHGTYLYIARNGTHYPLEVAKPGRGMLTFTQWNNVSPITASPASRVISLPDEIG